MLPASTRTSWLFSEKFQLHACVRGLQMSDNCHRRQVIGIQLFSAQNYAHGAGETTDDRRFRYIANLLNVVLHLIGDGAQLIAVVMLTPERHGRMGTSSMDRALMSAEKRPAHSIEIRVKLACNLDQCIFLGRADQKADNDQALPRRRRRVHIFDPRDLMNQILDRSVTRSSTSAGEAPGMAV